MCSCLSFPLFPYIQTFIYHPKPETWGLIYSLQNAKKCGDFFNIISRSSMQQGRNICQPLIFPHSIYICILSFCDNYFTSPPDILLDKKRETLAPLTSRGIWVSISPKKAVSSTACTNQCPPCLHAGGCHPHHTALSFSPYPALDPAQKYS